MRRMTNTRAAQRRRQSWPELQRQPANTEQAGQRSEGEEK